MSVDVNAYGGPTTDAHVYSASSEDVGEANDWGDSRFYPLTSRFGFRFRGVVGQWGRSEVIEATAPCLIEHCDAQSLLYVPLGIGHEPRVRGRDLPHDSLLPLPEGTVVSARLPGPTRYASVAMPPDTGASDRAADELLHPESGRMRRLQRLILALFEAVDDRRPESSITSLGEAIADATYDATSPRLARRQPLDGEAARVVDDAMAAVRGGLAASVSEICAICAVSRSTLYRAFDDTLGLSPYAWIQLQRITSLRSRLIKLDPEPGVVTREAAALGVFHLGNLARAYRSQFGETPVETLRRS